LVIISACLCSARAMQAYDLAIPTLPMRSAQATVDFYRRLGFEGGPHPSSPDYVILRRGDVELHFFAHPDLVPADSSAGCYIRVQDVATLYAAWLTSQLPSQGIPRMEALQDKPWGLREFAVLDGDGNLLRVGQIIQT
jgi:catechol 2,3-dioxygenase-like lactoylglutathione lyase family enzyme